MRFQLHCIVRTYVAYLKQVELLSSHNPLLAAPPLYPQPIDTKYRTSANCSSWKKRFIKSRSLTNTNINTIGKTAFLLYLYGPIVTVGLIRGTLYHWANSPSCGPPCWQHAIPKLIPLFPSTSSCCDTGGVWGVTICFCGNCRQIIRVMPIK